MAGDAITGSSKSTEKNSARDLWFEVKFDLLSGFVVQLLPSPIVESQTRGLHQKRAATFHLNGFYRPVRVNYDF